MIQLGPPAADICTEATRFVREETGSGLWDGEEDLVELPTSWSKRAVYSRFCYERGFVMTSTPRGNIKKTERSDPEWNNENKKRFVPGAHSSTSGIGTTL